MKYVVYDPASGNITISGDCTMPSDQGLGTLLEDVDGSFWTHYVANGALVAYTPAQVAAKAQVPTSDGATWSNTAMAWLDGRTLADAQADQIDALTDAYNAAIAVSVSFTTAAGVTGVYQADPDSRQKLSDTMLGCQGAQQTPPGFFWVPVDNSHVPFTYADLQGLAAAIFAQGASAFAKLQTLKAQVLAATTNTQVTGITWTN